MGGRGEEMFWISSHIANITHGLALGEPLTTWLVWTASFLVNSFEGKVISWALFQDNKSAKNLKWIIKFTTLLFQMNKMHPIYWNEGAVWRDIFKSQTVAMVNETSFSS